MDVDDTNLAAVTAYARAMTAQGKGRKAAGVIERAWAVKPGSELLAAYRMLVPGESALDWARRIDGLAKVTGQKIYARDFRAADLPGWPRTERAPFASSWARAHKEGVTLGSRRLTC